MYTIILVPLDGSKRAEKIRPYVEELAYTRESTVVLLQVIEPAVYMAGTYDTMTYFDTATANRAVAEAKSYLGMLAGEMREKGVAVGAQSHCQCAKYNGRFQTSRAGHVRQEVTAFRSKGT
jgi:nucleotide-binding universal stress UspA family protein